MKNRNYMLKGTVLGLTAIIALTGCTSGAKHTAVGESQKTETSTGTGQEAAQWDANVNEAGVLPIVKEKITLKVAIRSNPQVEDFVNNDFTKWLEEQTNIHLEFTILPDNDTDTKINLMFAAGKDLPDVVITTAIKNDSLYKYALDGLVVPLDRYIEEYGKDYPDMLADNPEIESAMVAPDGHIYGLPKYNVTLHNQMKDGKMYLYKPWLDKLGLEIPKTPEELYQVLKAFKTQDPNGNGKPDEVPMAGATTGSCTNVLSALISPYIPYSPQSPNGSQTNGLLNENGAIIATYTTEEFKQGMEFAQKMVGEGLVDPVSFTQDQQQLKQLANRDEVILGGYVHAYAAINANDSKLEDYVCVPLLQTDTGKGGFLRDRLIPKGASYVVTSSCKYPEAAYRLADFLVSKEAGMRNRYGVENRDWKYVDSEKTELVGLDSEPARFEIINNVWGETGSVFWRSECLYYNDYENVYGKGFHPDAFNPDSYHHENTVLCVEPYVVGDLVPVDSLFFTDEELGDYSILATSINEHVSQQLAAFATGGRSMDQWETFQEELKGLGIEQYLAYIQTAYDRQFGKQGES